MNTWRNTLALLSFLVLSQQSDATVQEPERIEVEGTKLPLLNTPLDDDSEIHWRLKIALDDYIGRERRTSNHRGYVAQWRVAAGELELIRIEVAGGVSAQEIQIQRIFPTTTAGPAFASWFTGELLIGLGENVPCEPPRFALCYKSYRVLRVEKGMVTNTTERGNRE